MASKGSSKRGNSNNNPEQWSDAKLLNTSLSTLSKTLSDKLSSRRTLVVYLKWLEIHRVHPSSLTKFWGNTIMQWAQALRARGFKKEDLISDIRKWKDEHGPFSSPTSHPNERYPPTLHDIAKAWPEGEFKTPGSRSDVGKHGDSCHPGKSSNQQPENFSKKPLGDYTCNRCSIQGHFLEACPTNIDPSYDRAPGMSYTCPLCFEIGKHYKSLCPLNTDPFSIIQKRRDLRIETPGSGFGILRDWEKKVEEHENDDLLRGRPLTRSWGLDPGSTAYHASRECNTLSGTRGRSPNSGTSTNKRSDEIMRKIQEIDDMRMHIEQSDTINTADVMAIRYRVDGSSTLQKRTRVTSPDSASTRSRRSINEKSPSPTKSRILRNKLAYLESAEKRAAGTMSEGLYAAEKAALLTQLHEEENSPGKMDRDYDVDATVEGSDAGREQNADATTGRNAPSPKRAKFSYRHRRTSSSKNPEEMDIDEEEVAVHPKPKIVKHSDFVQKLIDRHPEMKEVVHAAKRRPTALDMWNNDDDRRMREMAITSKKSFSSSSLDDGYEPDTEMSESPVKHKHLATKKSNGLDSAFGVPKNKENAKPSAQS